MAANKFDAIENRWEWIVEVCKTATNISGDFQQSLKLLSDLDKQKQEVISKTTALHEQSQSMLEEQSTLAVAVEKIKQALKTRFQCKFQIPADFLGMDIKIHSPGDIELSMRTFSKKMVDNLNINDNVRANVYTPGRTDCKITKSDDDDKTNADDKDDGTYRS